MVTRDRVIKLFNLESNQVRAYDRSQLRLLEAFAGVAAVSIERAFLYEEQKEKEEIQKELRVARTVQEFFTPALASPVINRESVHRRRSRRRRAATSFARHDGDGRPVGLA